MESSQQVTGEYRIIEDNERGVAICPYCGAARPYASKLESLLQCNRQTCKRTFEIIPHKKNWKAFSEYEKEERSEMERQMAMRKEYEEETDKVCTMCYNSELTQREAAKKLGVSVGKMNGLMKEYRQKRWVQGR